MQVRSTPSTLKVCQLHKHAKPDVVAIVGRYQSSTIRRKPGVAELFPLLDPVAIVAGLDDVVAVREPIEQRRHHLGVAM